MTNKNTSDANSFFQEETKDTGSKHNLSKFDYDLYHEEDDIALPIIRVKHNKLPNNGERWRIYANDKIAFTLDGDKLLKKERAFLHTVDGILFLIAQHKQGIRSFHALHLDIKSKLKELTLRKK